MFPSLSQVSFTSVIILGVSIFLPIFFFVCSPAASRPLIRSITPSLISWSFRVPLMYPLSPAIFFMSRGPEARSAGFCSSSSSSSSSGVPPQPGGGACGPLAGIECAGAAGPDGSSESAGDGDDAPEFLSEADLRALLRLDLRPPSSGVVAPFLSSGWATLASFAQQHPIFKKYCIVLPVLSIAAIIVMCRTVPYRTGSCIDTKAENVRVRSILKFLMRRLSVDRFARTIESRD
mmetsp:Transcript_10481/g.20714  ORF Transcript_10481/g.20714 Transcript_10481/m.20714 type:complete len:234 (+) Transcript_10481:1958-2659(+)